MAPADLGDRVGDGGYASSAQEPRSWFWGLACSLSAPAWVGAMLEPSFCHLWQLLPLQDTPPLRLEGAVCASHSRPNH